MPKDFAEYNGLHLCLGCGKEVEGKVRWCSNECYRTDMSAKGTRLQSKKQEPQPTNAAILEKLDELKATMAILGRGIDAILRM